MTDEPRQKPSVRPIIPPGTRFWKYVDKHESGCWLWTGSLNKWGYGQLYAGTVDGKRLPPLLAHRLSYQINVGPIPEGLDVDHVCRVRSCVSPLHLEPVTRRTNLIRGVGFVSVNAKKTQCVNGHPFDALNTAITKNGWRRCKACNRENARVQAAKRRSDHGT